MYRLNFQTPLYIHRCKYQAIRYLYDNIPDYLFSREQTYVSLPVTATLFTALETFVSQCSLSIVKSEKCTKINTPVTGTFSYYHGNKILLASPTGLYKTSTSTTATPSMHRPWKVQSVSTYWLSTNFYSLEMVYSHRVRCVTVIASSKRHFVVYWALSRHFGRLLRDVNAGLWWLAVWFLLDKEFGNTTQSVHCTITE